MFSFENTQNITYSGPFNYGNEISLTIKRLDLTDNITGGNKWFKLKHNLYHFKEGQFSEIVTFGGAFSNHIAAVARVGKNEGIKTIGIIRGEPESARNITLSRAARDGMKLIFISRNDYKKKGEISFLKNLMPDFKKYLIIPEGGSNSDGVRGCTEILEEKDGKFSHIAVACGTGATAAGLILSLKKNQHLIGFSVLKDRNSIEKTIIGHLNNFIPGNHPENWHIEHDYHFGGYAKSKPELTHFIQEFLLKTGVSADPIYTGKVFFGLEQLIKTGYFIPGSKILAIHTGGLQYLK